MPHRSSTLLYLRIKSIYKLPTKQLQLVLANHHLVQENRKSRNNIDLRCSFDVNTIRILDKLYVTSLEFLANDL